MKYEVKHVFEMEWNGIEVTNIYKTDAIEFTKKSGLDAIKFIPEGKSRFKWITEPNEYMMRTQINKHEIIITEIKTGRVVYNHIA